MTTPIEPVEKNFKVTTFGNVAVGATFRHKIGNAYDWCQKQGPLTFLDGHAYKHPAPKFDTLVVTESHNCLTR